MLNYQRVIWQTWLFHSVSTKKIALLNPPAKICLPNQHNVGKTIINLNHPQITLNRWHKPFPNGWFIIVYPHDTTCCAPRIIPGPASGAKKRREAAQHRRVCAAPAHCPKLSGWCLAMVLKMEGSWGHGLSWCWWNQCLLYDPSMTGKLACFGFLFWLRGLTLFDMTQLKKRPTFHTSVLAHVPLIRSEWLPPPPFQGAVVHWWGDANHKFHDVTLNALGRSLLVWFTWWCFTFPMRSLPVADSIGENEKNMEKSNFLGGS